MNVGAKEPSAAPSPSQAVQAGETGASPMGEGRRWVSAGQGSSGSRRSALLPVPPAAAQHKKPAELLPMAWVERAAITVGHNADVAQVTAAPQKS